MGKTKKPVKKFKDETLYHDAAKERMHYLIKERINEVLTQKQLTMAQYTVKLKKFTPIAYNDHRLAALTELFKLKLII